MAQPWNHATILLVVAVLSVVVMVAGVPDRNHCHCPSDVDTVSKALCADGAEGCAQVGTGEMAEAGDTK